MAKKEQYGLLIVEAKPAEQERAKKTVEAAGHRAVVMSRMYDVIEAISDRTDPIDGVITDLALPLDQDEARLAPLSCAMGLLVVVTAQQNCKPSVICTSSDHHETGVAWVQTCFVTHYVGQYGPETSQEREEYIRNGLPFGWVDNKDWGTAVEVVLGRIERGY